MSDTELIDHTGRTVFRGTQKPPGGAAGAAIVADFIFTEVATAGTYTATLDIPAGGFLLDAFLIPETAVWASSGAALNVGDTAASDDIFSNQGLDGSGTNAPYDPGPITGGPSVTNDYMNAQAGGTTTGYAQAVWSARDAAANGTGTAPGIPYPAGTTITMEAVTTHVGTVVPTGIMRVRLIYVAPSVSAATFA